MVVAASVHSVDAAILTYFEDFDGNTNGYNPAAPTALLGDEDWVDFHGNPANPTNRIAASAIGTAVEGYTTASTGETVLAGASVSNDPQIRSDFGFGIDKTLIEEIEIRIRIDNDQSGTFDDTLAGTEFTVFAGTIPHNNPGAFPNVAINNLGAPTSLVAQADGWHVATWDNVAATLSGGAGGADPTLEALRIDPTNLATGNGDSFEIDYLSITTAVPEPTSILLGCAGLFGVCLVRRRSGI